MRFLSQALLAERKLDLMVSTPEKETGCGHRDRKEGRMVPLVDFVSCVDAGGTVG